MTHRTRQPGSSANGVKSAYRTLDILEALAKSDRALTHSELSVRIGVPKSSLTQLLRTLESRAYLESLGPTGPYRLGLSAVNLVRRGLDVQKLVSAASIDMGKLVARTNQSCGLNVLNGDYVERVCAITAPDSVGFAMHVGVRAPLYASSSGKLFLAFMKNEDMESYLERVELRPITQRSLRSIAELRRQIRVAREECAAYSRDEFTNGIVGFSVPILDAHSRMTASLGLAVPTAMFDARRASLMKELRLAARAVSVQLSTDGVG